MHNVKAIRSQNKVSVSAMCPATDSLALPRLGARVAGKTGGDSGAGLQVQPDVTPPHGPADATLDKYHRIVYICRQSIPNTSQGILMGSGKERAPLSPAQWKVMRIVWRLQPCAARDVIAAAEAEYGWSPSTVKTLLRRLVDKRQLKTRQIGNSFLYRPAQPAIKTLCQAADTLLSHAVDGTVAPLLMHMAQRGQLSPNELSELRALFEELTQPGEEPKQ